MPKRFLTYSRTEPAKTILWLVAVTSGIAQVAAVVLSGWSLGMVGVALAIPNALIVLGVAHWAIWACYKNNLKQMARSSMTLFMFWIWSGLSRLFLSPDPGMLLWVPFIIIGLILSVVYLYLSNQRRMSDLD